MNKPRLVAWVMCGSCDFRLGSDHNIYILQVLAFRERKVGYDRRRAMVVQFLVVPFFILLIALSVISLHCCLPDETESIHSYRACG